MMLKLDFFLVFLLTHLIGDFVLQTNRIAKLKATTMKGLILHSIIVMAVQVALMSLFGVNGTAAAVISGIAHFMLDYSKNLLYRYFERLQFFYFILDQLMHIVIIVFLTMLFAGNSPVSAYQFYIRLLISLLILGYAATVAVKILLGDLHMCVGGQNFFKAHERQFDALSAIICWSIWHLPQIWGLLLVLAVFLPYSICQKKIFGYDTKVTSVKYFALAAIAFLLMTIM